MSCTCFSVRLLIGLDAWVMITRPFQATGVKVSRAFCGLPSEGRALPARSAVPLLTASMPEAVLNGCSSTRPWPALVQAAATSLITALAVASSPRQIRLLVLCAGLLAARWVLASATVERQAPNRATDSRRTRRTDMIVGNPGVIENNGMRRADRPQVRPDGSRPGGLSGFGWPVCESDCAVHIPADSWSIEPLWTGKSSEICPRTAAFSPRPPKPDGLLGYFIGLNTKHQALSCICAMTAPGLCAGARLPGDPRPLFACHRFPESAAAARVS